MPYHLIEKDGKFCIAHEGEDKPMMNGDAEMCGADKDKMMAQMQAMMANEGKSAETFIAYGGAIKALGDGRIGGYLVRFTASGDYDLEGERFTANTDYGDRDSLPVLYQHGMDSKLGKRIMAKAQLKRDEFGIWAETQLALRDEYERFIYTQTEKGRMGWSSGATSHLVEKMYEGKGYAISMWHLAEGSITPTPAEPRNSVMPLKALKIEPIEIPNETDPKAQQPQATATTGAAGAAVFVSRETKNNSIEEKREMDEKEIKAAIDEATKPLTETVGKLSAQLEKVTKALENEPAANPGVVSAPNVKKVTERGFKDDEVKSFLHWIRTGDDVAYKAAMQGQTDSEGGYAVPDDFFDQVVAKRDQVSVMRIAGVNPYSTSLDRVLIPIEGTSATKFVVTAEEGSYDENEPTLGQKIVTVHKLTKLVKISEELEADAKANFGGWLSNVFGRAVGLAENYYFCNVAANGSGVPESVTYAATATTAVASQTATTAAELLTLIYGMPSAYADNMRLLMRRSTLGAFRALASSSIFTFMPTPAGSGQANVTNASPNGELHGVPVLVTDDLPAQAAANVPVVLFNPDFYFIAEREGMSVSRNPYLYQATGQIGLFAKVRIGGGLLHATTAYQLVSKT